MDFIKKTWANQATTHGTSHTASWGDIYAIQLEIEAIGKQIKKGDHVLDVGCANGYATFKQLSREPSEIVGIDFVEEMVAFANEERLRNYPKNNISFQVGDIRNIEFQSDTFDTVYTTRVLINLPNWEEQKQGIKECIRVAKPGGTIVLSEAFWEPLVKLNALRSLASLPSLVEHDFNRYIKNEKLISFLRAEGFTFKVVEFSSLYYLGSRFVRELITGLKDSGDYQNNVNRQFFELEKEYDNNNDFGIQKAFVIRK